MLQQGRLKNWNDEKGFGFIVSEGSSADIFIHISSFKNHHRPQINQQIRFRLSVDKKGRSRADKAEIVAGIKQSRRENPKHSNTKNSRRVSLSVIWAILFSLLLLSLVVLNRLPIFILLIYCFMSLLSFALYNMDKQAAQLNYWRIKENTLHLIALFGGWPGALVAQQLLRHKTQKTSFRILFIFTLLINISALAWLFTTEGQSVLNFIDINIQISVERVMELISNK